jgi:hypothetical protein
MNTQEERARHVVFVAMLIDAQNERNRLRALEDDPPDPNFATIGQPTPAPRLKVSPGRKLPARVARAVNALTENGAWLAGYLDALVTSINRAQGAANAGNASLQSAQTAAAGRDALLAAQALDTDGRLRARLAKALKAAHLNPFVSRHQLDATRKRVAKRGLPRRLKKVLKKAGVSDADLQALRQVIATTRGTPGHIAALLTSRKLNNAEHGLAQALRTFAAEHPG